MRSRELLAAPGAGAFERLKTLEPGRDKKGQPVEGADHPFYRHHHLSWNREAGLQRFLYEINLLFARNGIAFELTPTGQARRLLPQPLAEALAWTSFSTGEPETDRLLESARLRIASPKPEDRQDAVEKLWDAPCPSNGSRDSRRGLRQARRPLQVRLYAYGSGR